MPVIARSFLTWACVLLVASAHIASAQDASAASNDEVGWGSSDDSGDEAATSENDEAGWGSAPETPAGAGAVDSGAPSPWALGGRYRLRNALWLSNTNGNPWAQGRSLLGVWARYSTDFEAFGAPATLRLLGGIRGEYDAAYLVNRDQYDAPTLETYEWQIIGDESYASLVLGAFELAAGLLQMPFGQGELLGVLNLLNPRDLRDPGMTDPEDTFQAVLATRIGLTLGRHRVQAFVVEQAAFGLRAPPLGRLSPLRKLLAGDPLAGEVLSEHVFRYHDEPTGFAPASWQVVGRYGFTGEWFDFELYGGSVLDKLGVVKLPAPAEFDQRELVLRNFHPRYEFAAASGSIAVGEALLRFELIAERDRPQAVRVTDTDLLRLDVERDTQLSGLIGITYFGLSNVNVGLELQQGYVLDNPARRAGSARILLLPVESTNAALRLNYDFMRERMRLLIVAVLIGVVEFNSALVRAEISYVLSDGLRIALGGIGYVPSANFGPFYGFEDNNRVYLDLRWDFSIL